MLLVPEGVRELETEEMKAVSGSKLIENFSLKHRNERFNQRAIC